MNDTHRTSRKLVEDAGTDLVNGALEAARDSISNIADTLQGRGEKMLKTAQQKGMKAWEDIQDRGENAAKGAKTWIRQNPLTAVGCAVAAGVVLYAIFSRDSE